MDFKDLLQTAQQMQTEMTRIKQELAGKSVEADAGGGMVRCAASGKGDVLSVTIDPSLLPGLDPPARKMIEDLVVGAVNVALDRAREMAERELSRAAGGLNLPPGILGRGP